LERNALFASDPTVGAIDIGRDVEEVSDDVGQ